MEIAKQHQGTIKGLLFHESDMLLLLDEKDKEQESKEKLAKFKSLEKVSIFAKNSSHLSSFDNIISDNLKSLDLISKGLPQESHPGMHHYVDLKEINPCLNIKELKLNIPLSDDSSIKYLMHKFPKLEILEYNDFTTLSVSEDTREAFTDYLLNIKTLRLYYTLVCESDSPMDYFFIKKLIRNSKAKNCKKQPNFSVCFRPRWGSFISKDYFSKEIDNGIESYKITVGLEETQRLNYLKSFGIEFTELEITKSNGDELSLNKIFKYCPNLNGLDVKGFDAILGKKLKKNAKNLKTLKYFSCGHFTSEILSKWFKFFPNLIDLTFEGSNEATIDVSSIIAAFPNLDRLKIVNVKLSLSNLHKKSSTIKTLKLDSCEFPSDGFLSGLSHCLPNVHSLKLWINGDDLESNEYILDIPEASLKYLFFDVQYQSRKKLDTLLNASLLVDNKETVDKKQYYLSEMDTCERTYMMKRCTELEYESVISGSTVEEYESVISESTEDEYESTISESTADECESIISKSANESSLFQLVVNCKKFPFIVQLSTSDSGMCFIANSPTS